MLFSETSGLDYMRYLHSKTPEFSIFFLPRTVFILFTPNKVASFPLLTKYKPQQKNSKSLYRSNQNDDASLKLHISITNISNVEFHKICNIHTFLMKESQEMENASFSYKMIDPKYVNNKRFRNHDQFTLYFNKYSSLKDILDFSKRLNQLLKDQALTNTQGLGPKDLIRLGEFTSARFDTDKRLDKYGIYPAFDKEINKFLKRYLHSPHLLAEFPLCDFEIVFNNFSLKHNEISSQSNQSLTSTLSHQVQSQLNLLAQSPQKYIQDNEQLIIDTKTIIQANHFITILMNIAQTNLPAIAATLVALTATLLVAAILSYASIPLLATMAIAIPIGAFSSYTTFFALKNKTDTEDSETSPNTITQKI